MSRYYIKKHEKTGNFLVHDKKSQIVVIDEQGNKSQGTLIAGFKTEKEAVKFIERMTLRDAWGV